MAKVSKKANKIDTAAIETEGNTAIMLMANELVEDNVLEALEDTVTEAVDVPEASVETPVDNQIVAEANFDEVLNAIDDATAIAKAIEIGKAIDERADFEKAKGNDNIQKALSKSRKQLATPRAARVMIACNVDPSMINRSVHEGVRYNVYALGKLADAIGALSGGSVNNAINVACMKSLFRFRAGGVAFTGEMAKAAASDKVRVDVGLRGMLVRHTVSVSTSSTQASSTMQALVTLGVVSKSGSHKNPTFELTNSPVVTKLEEVLAKAA